jgi:hypothetical protein
VLGRNIPAEAVSLGKRDPHGVLQQLAGNSKKKWDANQAICSLDSQDIERIRAIPEVTELNTFLQDLQKDEQAA